MTKKKRKRWENRIRSVKKSLRASENRFFGVSENAWVHRRDAFRRCQVEVLLDKAHKEYWRKNRL
jgi:hypothetical protein